MDSQCQVLCFPCSWHIDNNGRDCVHPGVVRQNSISEMTSGALCRSVYTAETALGEGTVPGK